MVNIASLNYLPQIAQWEAQIPRLEDGFWPTGGAVDPATDSGLMNWQSQLLGNRTAFLKAVIDGAGIGLSAGVLVGNLDTITLTGTYRAAAGVTGAPMAGTAFTVEHRAGASTAEATQEAWAIGSDRSFSRRRVGGAWQAWRESGLLGTGAGFVARDAAGAPAARSLTAGTGVAITNADGAAGDPQIAVDLASAFGSSLGNAGWQRLPSGLIVQWGTYTTAGGTVNVTFPLAFPNAVFRVLASEAAATGWSGSNVTMHGVGAVSTTGFTARSVTWGGSSFSGSIATGNFWAIGN